MARPGVGLERIEEVIREMAAQGREPTVTAIRERLGSGSFSTIGMVLSEWRSRRASEARPAAPEPPESVRLALGYLWTEAWTAANKVLEPERQGFARERQEHDRTRGEMLAEIARLEADLEAERERGAQVARGLASERDACRDEAERGRAALAAAEGALEEARRQVGREEARGRELSERVIAEAASARSLQARIEDLEAAAHASSASGEKPGG